jgi:nicotinamide-nucleotide amidase
MEVKLKPVYAEAPRDIGMTTLAAAGDLAIRLSFTGPGPETAAQARLGRLEKAIVKALGPWIYSRNGESLEEVVGGLLRARGLTIACAESCTGGLVGHRLTDIPGSSDYFLESAVVYSNRAKVGRLGVPASLIDRHGAVSAPVARAMALGIRRTSGADIGLSITGVAGPGGGTPRKPVGLVYIALARGHDVKVAKSLFFGGRSQVKFQSSQKALDMVRKALTAGPGTAL